MAKIETDIGINVGIDNAPVPQDGNITTATSQIVGKNSWQELADIFATINPAIRDLTQKNIEEKAEKDFELGKAKINGMTLAEAEVAHKQGFPSIMNGWAKYGAHKQYAVNSVDSMISNFKDDYLNRRHEPNYDWRSHYDEYSSKFLASVEGDEVFASAFNEQTTSLRKWLNVKEFEKQEDKLKYTVIANASKQIQSIPEQVEQALEVAFYEANPPMTLGKDYQERKSQFFRDNMSKTYLEMFETIKANKNPALSLSEFDDIVISEAELHASLDGRFSAEFIEILTQPRPDGTPAIINVTKHKKRVVALVDKLRESIQLQANTVQWWNGELASSGMKKSDRVEVGANAFEKEQNKNINAGDTPADAFLKATMTLIPAMGKNEPITQIVDLFDKPLSSAYTEDAKLAFEVYAALDQRGLVGMYFNENDKNKYKFFIGDVLSKAGVAPQDIIRQLGTMDNMTKTFTQLTSANKIELEGGFSANMAYAPNKELVYTIAEYFKNINTDVNDNYINQTKQFIEKYYEDVNGRYVSKYKLNQFGVTKDNYDAFKVSAIEVLQEKLNTEKSIIQETSLVGFFFDETNIDVAGKAPNVNEGIDLNNYELIVNSQSDTLYFRSQDGFMTDVPETVEYKDGRMVWLEVPIDLVKNKLAEKAEIQKAKDLKLKIKKDKKERESKKFWKKLHDAEMEHFGQGQIYKF